MDKKTLFIEIFIVLFVMACCCGSFFVVRSFTSENVKQENTDTTNDNEMTDEENTDNSSVDIDKPATEVYEKLIHYNGDYIDLSSYIIEFDNKEENKDKLLTLIVDGIKLDDKEYKFSFKNHPKNCAMGYDYMREGYNEFYINDKLIYAQKDQSCYLERVKYLTIIDNKYIVITYEGQTGNYIKVYDMDINLVDTFRYKDIEIKKDEIVYSEYSDSAGCYLNYFKYDIVNGNIINEFKKNVKNTECNEITGDGCNCDNRENDGIKFDLHNMNETYIYDKLTLNFNGVETKDINNEESYQYTLDIVLDGKKIDSNIFSNNDKKVIWSSNYAASFRIVDIDNYYILISNIAKQNDGSYVLVLDKEGNVLKTFEDVGIKINKEKLELEITDCDSGSVTAQCLSKVYSLRDFK